MVDRTDTAASGHNLEAALALPDSHAFACDRVLSAKDAAIGGMLTDFNFANQLSQSGTITGSVFTSDSDLLGALAHIVLFEFVKKRGD